jgi:AcrR family transcriptional regulator
MVKPVSGSVLVPTASASDALQGRSARRERILDAALELFVERGYAGTTMDDIGAALDIKGPSLYKHVRSKHDLLAELMTRSIRRVHAAHDAAVATSEDPVVQLRRAVEAHVRFHAEHRLDAFLGSRELGSLEGDHRATIIGQREAYERSFRRIVQSGIHAGRLAVTDAKLTAFALLDMGTGVAVWFRPDGEQTVDQLAYRYGDLAMRMVGATD